MAGRKKAQPFRNAPFKDALKGASASLPPESKNASPAQPENTLPPATPDCDFDREMAALGVRRLTPDVGQTAPADQAGSKPDQVEPSDRELFLESLGRLDSHFQDKFPEARPAAAEPRRMKQVRQGKLKPEAQLDLHGQQCEEALARVGHFLENACFHQLRCVLIITGRGQHSAQGPVLRQAVEDFLSGPGEKLIAEWGRAPRQYGGEGALVVFLPAA